MNPKNPQEMARLAATVRLAGELLESHGYRALYVTDSWKPGPRSANLEPHGGARYEEITYGDGVVELVAIPSDVTGEAVLNPDALAGDHERLTTVIGVISTAADEVVHILRKAAPSPLAVLHPDDLTPAQVSAAGWCTCCWEDGTYHEPVAMRPNGERRYRDHCRWCGEFVAAHDGVKPPLSLLEARHRGERITETMIDQALTRVAEEKKRAKAERKKNKKKKAA